MELIGDSVLTRRGVNEEEPNSWERLNADRDHVLETVQAENRVQKPQMTWGTVVYSARNILNSA